ncbi:MAG: ATP-binding protein [Planctomycetota bacterium]|nr:ATP-binding protein [Planctomycetota bacterium]
MPGTYIQRSLEPVLKRAAKEFPVVVLTGPRQSGKTTLLKHLFGKRYAYVSLEPPDVRAAAISDPRGFLDMYPPPAIFDEVQYTPELLPYVKERVDAHRDKAGQYLLTGSQNLLLLERVSESLAGRAAILRLLPLSFREIAGAPLAPFPWESGPAHSKRPALPAKDLWENLLRGCYPEPVANPRRDISLWHASYAQTYLERDVRSLRQIGDLTQFQNFLRALAARNAQLLNLTDLSRELGIAVNTVKAWLSVLEATFQIILLRPYFANVGKRLVKTPKVYFTDTGTLCHLAGLRTAAQAASGLMGGAILETAVVTEIVKVYWNRGQEPQVYFWRTAAGAEVDVVVQAEGSLIPIEVKLSATPNLGMARGIEAFRRDFYKRAAKGYVVHAGDVRLPLSPDATALPFADF